GADVSCILLIGEVREIETCMMNDGSKSDKPPRSRIVGHGAPCRVRQQAAALGIPSANRCASGAEPAWRTDNPVCLSWPPRTDVRIRSARLRRAGTGRFVSRHPPTGVRHGAAVPYALRPTAIPMRHRRYSSAVAMRFWHHVPPRPLGDFVE